MSKIIAANWKMYKTQAEAITTVKKMSELITAPAAQVLIFAPFTALQGVKDNMSIPGAELGAQNLYPATEGAFTGEISPAMLKDCGCTWVLTGHSERRHVLHENNDFVAQKTAFALENGLNVILCIGETLAERENGQLEQVLKDQLSSAFSKIKSSITPQNLIIAYEPVWAIGTGKTAQAQDIIQAHALVRNLLIKSCDCGQNLAILYGGSVKADNAKDILPLDNVGGLLVGGASLSSENFAAIIQAAV